MQSYNVKQLIYYYSRVTEIGMKKSIPILLTLRNEIYNHSANSREE